MNEELSPENHQPQDPVAMTTVVQNNAQAAKFEIYKFVLPILLSVVGVMLYFELNAINTNIEKTNTKVENLNSSVSTLTGTVAAVNANISDLQRETDYTRQRLDTMQNHH